MTTIYVTRYALTSGILKVDAVVKEGCARYKPAGAGFGFAQYVSGSDFQMTLEDALARAEEMRTKKLASLEKQRKKLSSMDFKIHELN